MKVAVVGTGYVGLVTGVVLAELGNDVTCVDKDQAKVDMLRRGEPPIYEPGIEEMLRRGLHSGHLQISDSISEATATSEVVFIAVGTPPAEDGTPDLSAVKAVAKEIGKSIKNYIVVVNKSTVPVGAGDLVEKIILEQGASQDQFDVVSNPEFLREGSAIQDTLHPDRIVIGAKRRAAADRLVELYTPLEAPTIITDLNSAELIKYGANSFLAMKISFINAMSRVCELCTANVADVASGMGADKRIGNQFLNAGLGWGGSCFPKDVQGMVKTSELLGYDFRLLREVININEDQTHHFLDRLEKRLGGFEGKRIALMGLAFKANTDDIRDAKSLVIIQRVLASGGSIVAYDPVAADNVRKVFPQIEYADSVFGLPKDSDALILVTEWNEFRQLDLSRLVVGMKQPILFDGRRIYSSKLAEQAGFEYHTIGSIA
jgi:UDPglucose 6-dehydrogenase